MIFIWILVSVRVDSNNNNLSKFKQTTTKEWEGMKLVVGYAYILRPLLIWIWKLTLSLKQQYSLIKAWLLPAGDNCFWCLMAWIFRYFYETFICSSLFDLRTPMIKNQTAVTILGICWLQLHYLNFLNVLFTVLNFHLHFRKHCDTAKLFSYSLSSTYFYSQLFTESRLI